MPLPNKESLKGHGLVKEEPDQREDPISQTINQPSDVIQEIPGRTKRVTGKTNSIHSTNSGE